MRKHFIRTFVALLLVFTLVMGTTAFAESATVVGSAVNLRSGPGTNYQVLDTLTAGTTVEVTDRSNSGWYAVSYRGQNGYMSSGFLSLAADASQTAVVTGSAAAPSYDEGSGVIVMDGFSSYGDSSASSTTVIVESGSASAPAPAAPAAPSYSTYNATSGNEGSAVIILSDGSTVNVPSAPAAAPAASVSADTSKVGRQGSINADYVCLRSGPSSQYSILGKYNKGKELTIAGPAEGKWTPCTVDNKSGYIYTQYITLRESYSAAVATQGTASGNLYSTVYVSTPSPSSAAAASAVSKPSGNAYITGNNVRFRSGPSMSSSILGEFFYGNSVTITGSSGDWTAVSYKGQDGYVYSKYVCPGSYQAGAPVVNTIKTVSSGSGTTTSASSSGSSTGQQIANFALQFVGYPYSWGGKSPETGFDCSGFVYYVYSQFGYTLNRVACDQALNGVHVDPSNLQPGDVLCFYSNDNYYIGHTGIYIGNNKFVHASTSTTGVIITELGGYYFTRGYEARRIV